LQNYSASSTENLQSDSGRKSSPDTLTRYHFCAPHAWGKWRHRDRGAASHICRNPLTNGEQEWFKGLFHSTSKHTQRYNFSSDFHHI